MGISGGVIRLGVGTPVPAGGGSRSRRPSVRVSFLVIYPVISNGIDSTKMVSLVTEKLQLRRSF